MRLRARLLAAAFALLVPTLVLARWTFAVGSSRPSVEPLELPLRVGSWTMRAEDRLDPVSLALAAPDAHVVRRYEAPEGRGIWLYVGLYAERAGGRKGAHDPEVCYPAHGWEILGTRTLTISVGDEEFPVKVLEVHRGRLEEEVVYWFQPARRWPADPLVEQLLRVGDALAGRPQYAFVRLSAASTGSRSAAPVDLVEFARQIAWPVRSAVEASR